MVEQVDPNGIWRSTVAWAATKVARERKLEPIDHPIQISLSFYFTKPKFSRFTDYPAARNIGDLDKLLRTISDALQDAKIITDDARIVRVKDMWKLWAPIGKPAGCLIDIPLTTPQLPITDW